MFIKVINWCSHAILRKDSEPAFYLERDNWDDNYYKTRYHLHLSSKLTDDGQPVWIGEVKILRKGQRGEEDFQLEPGKLDFLDFRFCSVGQSLDYYERLSQLDKDLRLEILSALRDITIFPNIRKNFEHEDGLEVSLFHFLDKDDDIFLLGPAMISGDYSLLPQADVTFKFHLEGMKEPVKFEFDVPDHKYGDPTEPENRICVLTGNNESGKDKFITRLARLAFASNDDRDLLQNEGTLDPTNIGFTKIICFSYTPVISFRVPAIYLHEKEQITRDIAKGVGRFVYCGNHHLVRELEESLKFLTIDTDGRVWENENSSDESQYISLKTTEELGVEFVKAMEMIEKDLSKQDMLDEVFAFMKEVHDLQFITSIDFTMLREGELEKFFQHLAGESQILLHALMHLILRIVPRSLILFDAPETYLRPTLLTLLMKSIKHLLERENAMMIVSTQSPEILREVKRKNITIFHKEGESIDISIPEIETFGETTEAIAAYFTGLTPKGSQGDTPRTETFENFFLDL